MAPGPGPWALGPGPRAPGPGPGPRAPGLGPRGGWGYQGKPSCAAGRKLRAGSCGGLRGKEAAGRGPQPWPRSWGPGGSSAHAQPANVNHHGPRSPLRALAPRDWRAASLMSSPAKLN